MPEPTASSTFGTQHVNMPGISAVIITLNEEKNIGRCIRSLEGVVDDILIVDSGSTDRTVEIARNAGAQVIFNEFKGHIQQKNFAASKAKHDFVISLDADEALSEELKASIQALEDPWPCDGYTMNRLANYCGKWIRHCGWYPDRKLRLWDRRLGEWGGVNPHDRYSMRDDAEICHLHGDLLHFTFPTMEQHLRQVHRFAEITAREMHKDGRKTWIWHFTVRPAFRFLRDYILKLGFLDGRYGIIICRRNALGVYLKFRKLRELNRMVEG